MTQRSVPLKQMVLVEKRAATLVRKVQPSLFPAKRPMRTGASEMRMDSVLRPMVWR